MRGPRKASSSRTSSTARTSPDAQRGECGRAARRGHARHERRVGHRHGAERHDERDPEHLGCHEGLHTAGPAQCRQGREGEEAAADRQRRRAGERRDTATADKESGRRQAVQREQRRHRRERGADEHGAPVVAANARHGEGDRGHRSERGSDAHAGEVDDPGDLHRMAAEDVKRGPRDDRGHRQQERERREPFTEGEQHRPVLTGRRRERI